MGCPAPLQANQIQGGDYNKIFPVVQWLVRQVLDNRRATGDDVRRAAMMTFEENLGEAFEHARPHLVAASRAAKAARKGDKGPAPTMSREESQQASADVVRKQAASTEFVRHVLNRYKPARRMRRTAELWSDPSLDRQGRVQAALLEYGERLAAGTSLRGKGGGGGGGAAGGDGSDDEEEEGGGKSSRKGKGKGGKKSKAAREAESRMLGLMTSAKAGAGAAGGKAGGGGSGGAHGHGDDEDVDVGALLGEQSGAMSQAAAEYERRRAAQQAEAESGAMLANSRLGRAQAHKRKLARARRELQVAEVEMQAALEELAGVLEELGAVEQGLRKSRAHLGRFDKELAKLEAAAREQGKYDEWMALRKALAVHATMLEQERAFKANCKRQRDDLTSRLDTLRAAAGAGEGGGTGGAGDDDGTRLARAEAAFEEAKDKHRRMRALLGRRAREVQRIALLKDEVPSQAELMQYRARFEELYDVSASKTDETRKYFSMHQVESQRLEHLSKEKSIVVSVADSFIKAMASPKGRESISKQLAAIQSAVERTRNEQQMQLDVHKQQRDMKQVALQELQDQQRKYMRAVKATQDEAEKQERLQGELEARGIDTNGTSID